MASYLRQAAALPSESLVTEKKRRKNMHGQNIKAEAHVLVENLSNEASWDDLMKEIYVRQAIESGLADSRAGRVATVQEVREKYGLPA
jgi:predicted transcriptional regulator